MTQPSPGGAPAQEPAGPGGGSHTATPGWTDVRRLPDKQVRDVQVLHTILDAALVAHVGFVDDGRPVVVPFACARDGDRLLVHGSTGSRAVRTLGGGVPCCVTVTLLDGMVVARSQFESSMHYRSAMLFGTFEALIGQAKDAGLAALVERLLPGVDGQRPPSRRELAATAVLALPLTQWSVKVSSGDPDDATEDLDRPVWAGVVPLRHVWGEPRPAADLSPQNLTPPPALTTWPEGRA